MNQRNVKWHQLTPDATVAQLQTNASCGLSRKEARSRYRKYGANTLFDTKKTGFSHFLKSILTDPAMLLLLLACVLALCFSEVGAGVSALVCFAGGMCFVARLLYLEKRFCTDAARYRIPAVRVVRDGKEYLTLARGIVPGDVILLGKGDVVPADCRLIACHALTVLSLHPSEDGRPIWKREKKDAARIYAYGEQIPRPTAENMLYGGSEILEGEARAVVVEVGADTYLGGMTSFELPAEFGASKDRDVLSGIRPYLRFYAFALFILLLPLAVIGMLTTDKDVGIVRIFMSLCALVACGSQAFLTLHFLTPITQIKNERLRVADDRNRVLFKSTAATETLASLTDIVVLGRLCSSDGKLHLYRFASGSGESVLGDEAVSVELRSVCEAFLLLQKANEALPVSSEEEGADPYSVLRDELLSVSRFDVEALGVRLLRSSLVGKTQGGGTLLEVQTKDGGYHLVFTDRAAWLSRCTFFEDHGKARVLDFAARDRLTAFMRSATSDGCSLRIVMRQGADEKLVLLGIVAMREEIQPILPSVMEELRQCGVRVSFFLSNESAAELRYADVAGLPNAVLTASQARASGKELASFYEKYRVFAGFSEQEISALLGRLKRAGHRVATVGNRTEELSLLRASALSVACDPTAYHKRFGGDAALALCSSQERDTADHCAQSVRRHADVLISRAERTGGGLAALLQVISDCRASDFRLSMILKFLMASALPRTVFTVLSICTGIGLMSGAQILFGGILLETVGVLWLLSLFVPQNRLRKPLSFHQKRVERILTDRMIWLPPLVASVLTVLYTLIQYFCGVFTGEICVTYLFCSMLLLQLAALLLTALSSGVLQMPRQVILPVFAVVVPTALLVAFSVAFPSVNAVLRIGGWSLVSLLSLLLPLVFYLGAYLLLSAFLNRTAK